MERPRRILVVDDDEKNTILVQTILEDLGYELVAARNGRQALELLSPDIDLVLLDVVMPDMDGYEVARRIRGHSLYRDIPIIIVTVLSDRADRLAAVEAGANDFLCKPIDRIELQARMSSLLRMKDSQDEIKRQRAELVRMNCDLQEEIRGRKLIVEYLKQSEAKYRMIFENSPLGVFHFDSEGTITACNENFVEIIGSSREDLIGLNTLRDLKDPKIVAAIKEALSGGIGHYEDYYASVTANKTTPVKCDFGPIFGEHGSVIGGIAIVEDITQRKKAEEALRESETKYRTILETIADGYLEVDLKGNLTLVNDFMRGITGYTRDELLGINYRKIVHQDSKEQVYMAYNWVYRTGRVNPGVPFRVVRKDGTFRDVTVSVSLMRDSQGDPCGFRGTIRDVTERKALEEQLRHAAKMQAIGQLAGGIAHDFNNLLTAMMGYTNMLVHQLPPEGPYQEKLAQINRAAERAAALTQQLLAYGRKQVLNASHLNLNSVVEDFETMLKSILGETVQIEMALDPVLWTVHADPGQIEQILMNLAVNARDAMVEGGTLRIETHNATLERDRPGARPDVPPGDYVVVSVTDTGIGMDAETVSRIFDPFFTTKEKGVGTGLGLSTVYGIVKQHRGHITVKSQPSLGATFEVYLPRVDVMAQRLPETSPSEPEPGGFETVLVVEDEQLVRDLTCEALRLLGYRTLAAAAPDEALSLVRDRGEPIDLLLTDVVLPQMDGRSLYNELAKFFSNLRVAYMSGYTEDFIVHRGVLDPDVHFLQKPFTMTDLARTVREVLGKSSESSPAPDADS